MMRQCLSCNQQEVPFIVEDVRRILEQRNMDIAAIKDLIKKFLVALRSGEIEEDPFKKINKRSLHTALPQWNPIKPLELKRDLFQWLYAIYNQCPGIAVLGQ